MQKYLLVGKLAVQDLLEYKLDFFLHSLKYSLMIVMMTLVWLAVERDGQTGVFNQQQTVTYFLLAAALYSVSNFHPWYIEDDIRLGQLSKFLVKPISPQLYYFCFEAAKVALETGIKLSIFIILLLYFQLLPTIELTKAILLVLYIPLIFTFSWQWLTLASILTFWITESFAIRWAMSIFTRLLSGLLVPLVYFPSFWQALSFYLPFQHLAFTPIQFMLGNIQTSKLLASSCVLFFWILVATAINRLGWRNGLREYEGTGL